MTDILSLVTDTKFILITLVLVVVSYVIYRMWKRTNSNFEKLEKKQRIMDRQYQQGVVLGEDFPENSSNMSEETELTTVSDTEPTQQAAPQQQQQNESSYKNRKNRVRATVPMESDSESEREEQVHPVYSNFGQLQQLIQDHSKHNDQVYEEDLESLELLKRPQRGGDVVYLEEHQRAYDDDNDELIFCEPEFDYEPEDPSAGDTVHLSAEPEQNELELEQNEHEQNELEQKILEDMSRLDEESNEFLSNFKKQLQQIKEQSKPKPKPEPTAETKSKPKPAQAPSPSKVKPKIQVKIKTKPTIKAKAKA